MSPSAAATPAVRTSRQTSAEGEARGFLEQLQGGALNAKEFDATVDLLRGALNRAGMEIGSFATNWVKINALRPKQ